MIKNKIEFEIGGQVRKFHFGIGSIGNMLAHFDTDLIGLGQIAVKNHFKFTPTALFFGHAYTLEAEGKIVDFTIADVSEWVEQMPDQLDNEKILEALNVFFESVKAAMPKVLQTEVEEEPGSEEVKKN